MNQIEPFNRVYMKHSPVSRKTPSYKKQDIIDS